jgi:uncharacterized membrane protein YdbT with pleckstrin-like domain
MRRTNHVAYPEKLLAQDEEIVEHLHPHWITLFPAVLWFIVICGLSGVALAFLPDEATDPDLHKWLLYATPAVATIPIMWLTLYPIMRWLSTHYVFTTHRVMIRSGILKHIGRDIPLARINDVAYEQSLVDRILRAGTLTIESAGENGQQVLINIPRADQVQQTLNRLVESDSGRRSRPHGEPYQHGDERDDGI